MAVSDVKTIQNVLDEAFDQFKDANPEVAEAMQVLNISYAEYLRVLSGLRVEPQSVSGNSETTLAE